MINSKTVEKIIRKVFKSAKIGSINQYKGGIINQTYEIKASNPNKEFILRIYTSEDWKAKKEKYVYNLISHHTNIPIPKIYITDDSKKEICCAYSLLSKINGKHLDEVYKKSRKKELLIKAGEYLGMIHSIKLPKFGWIIDNGISPKFESWTEFLEYDLDEKLKNLRKFNEFPKELITQSRSFFSKKKSLLKITDKPCLLHKDYNFSHIIADINGINGIIDVEWAIAGHNEMDITKSCMWMFDKTPQNEKLFLEGYSKLRRISQSFYMRKPIYEFLIMISSLSMAYEHNHMKWLDVHTKKLREILKC